MTKNEYDELMKLLEFPITLASNYYSDNAESEKEYSEDEKSIKRICELLTKINVNESK